jgi:hypothetical protein
VAIRQKPNRANSKPYRLTNEPFSVISCLRLPYSDN